MSENYSLSNTAVIITAVLSILVFVLIIWQVLSLIKIRKLKEALRAEEKRHTIPLLTLKIIHEEAGIFLSNDSYCYAKNIVIKDMPIVLDLGFKKSLVLKFDDCDFLMPGQRIKLKFRIFDGKYEDASTRNEQLLYYFPNAEFDMQIKYSNVENVSFKEIISIRNKKFYVKEVKALS